jgi:hypothetical protein
MLIISMIVNLKGFFGTWFYDCDKEDLDRSAQSLENLYLVPGNTA